MIVWGKRTPGKGNSKCKPAAWVGACSGNLRGGEEAEKVGQLQGRTKTHSFGLRLKGTTSLLQTGPGKGERALFQRWLQKSW